MRGGRSGIGITQIAFLRFLYAGLDELPRWGPIAEAREDELHRILGSERCAFSAVITEGDKCNRMSFELEQLREAAEKYTYHDAGTHWVWPSLVWERSSLSPVARPDDAVGFRG
jgi:hypothetical protein